MAHHARIEEVSDSDSDPGEMDISDFDPQTSILAPANIPPPASRQPPEPVLQPQSHQSASQAAAARERSKNWQCLYPVYFDAGRSRSEGRRVGKEQAVRNPLARGIVDALCTIADPRNIVLEPDKTHPKDWSNPGRVRIQLKVDGKPMHNNVKNKQQLYNLVAEYLKSHPTHPDDPKKIRIAGLPLPNGTPPGPAIPGGWKMNEILPLHSPAVTGGGVSDNFLKDMMAEIQGGEAAAGGSGTGSGAGSGSESKKKKDKKKGKA